MTRITMGVVGRAALFDADAFNEADELGEALAIALEWFSERVGTPGLAVQMLVRDGLENAAGRAPGWLETTRAALLHELRAPVLLPGAYSPRLRRAIARLDVKIQSMIDDRRALANPPDDLLTRLLRARDEDGTRMSDRQVRDEAVTLFVAGHETTATSLTWAFYELARAPEVLARLVDEAKTMRSDDDFRDPSRMIYAIKVFKETLRLYPPAYLLTRRALGPVTVGGVDLGRGSLVFMSPYALHRRPDSFPDPDRFDPERFTPEAEAARQRSAYMPFGAGPRICMGNHFALMEAPIVLLALLRRISLDIAPARIEPDSFATLRPSSPIMATVCAPVPTQAAAQ